jgi:hypothetical protein
MRIRIGRARSRQACGTRGPTTASEAAKRSVARERATSPAVKARITRLVVEVGNHAQEWRSAAADSELAFHRWTSAARGERSEAAAAYLAATEREEAAANEYRRVWETCCTTTP